MKYKINASNIAVKSKSFLWARFIVANINDSMSWEVDLQYILTVANHMWLATVKMYCKSTSQDILSLMFATMNLAHRKLFDFTAIFEAFILYFILDFIFMLIIESSWSWVMT